MKKQICEFNNNIYISGKITGTDDYIARFAAAEEKLTKAGYKVVNPARTNATLPDLDWKQYMDVCIVLIDFCDSIYMLSDWEESKGAKIEHKIAEKKKKFIIYENCPNEDQSKYVPFFTDNKRFDVPKLNSFLRERFLNTK